MSAVFEQVMAQCTRGCFTGLLRVHAREGSGEIRFLSGIQDGVRFDSVEGDAALERLQSATEPEFEAISSLPPIDVNSTEPVPPEGGLHTFHAAQLMRYCESNSLTCALELEVSGKILTARYRLGELLSVEPDSEHTSKLAEAKQGFYRFRLPRFDLPAGVARQPAAVAAQPAAAKAAAPKTATPKAPAVAPSPSSAKVPAVSPKAPPASAPVKIAPSAILTPKAAPAPSRAAAPVAARPAAPAAVLHSAPDSASSAAVGRASPQRSVEPVVARAQESAGGSASARGVRGAGSNADGRQVAASPVPAAPQAALPHEAAAPLKPLWNEAASPAAQAAPLELPATAAPQVAPAPRAPVESPRPGAPGVHRSSERSTSAASSGFGSSAAFPPIAQAKPAAIAAKPREAREPVQPPVSKGGSAVYLWLLVVIAAVVGAWVALGRPLP